MGCVAPQTNRRAHRYSDDARVLLPGGLLDRTWLRGGCSGDGLVCAACVGQLDNAEGCNVLALDRRHVSPVQVGAFGEFFL